MTHPTDGPPAGSCLRPPNCRTPRGHLGRRVRSRPVLRGHQGLVHRRLRPAHGGPGGRLGGDQQRGARPGRRPHRLRQDAGGVPVVAGPAGRPPRRRRDERRAAGSSTSRRSRRWPSTSSATCAHRWPASARPPRGSGCRAPEIPVGIRSGDTPADERRAFARRPTDILITTPESLFLLLTSPAREALRGVETVIVDEVHAVAGTKRGAHLAVSLERLDELLDAPGPADRPVGHRPADRGGGRLPGRGRPVGSWRRRRPSSGTCRSSSRSRT